ncbi:hypothetical protein ANCDUO_11921 [Ancylostoma duodenale]|uniref:Uncharacterized protein n=1 Tax=Ancylostoma duodenale TaxID=51022 RepID=A0A0C2GGF1_9BILA|nr:hypothetical protein ANCDUO_11921 [Ancylostoma duodenale]
MTVCNQRQPSDTYAARFKANILQPHSSDSREGGDGWSNSEATPMDAVAFRDRRRAAGVPHRYAKQPSRTSAKVRTPKSELHRAANLYFIFIVVLNMIIGAFGKYISLLPISFVLGVTAIKDAFEVSKTRMEAYSRWGFCASFSRRNHPGGHAPVAE